MPEMPQRDNCCIFDMVCCYWIRGSLRTYQTYHTGENTLVTKALLATVPKYSSTQIIFQVKGLMYLWLQTCVLLSRVMGCHHLFIQFIWLCFVVYLCLHSSVGSVLSHSDNTQLPSLYFENHIWDLRPWHHLEFPPFHWLVSLLTLLCLSRRFFHMYHTLQRFHLTAEPCLFSTLAFLLLPFWVIFGSSPDQVFWTRLFLLTAWWRVLWPQRVPHCFSDSAASSCC